MNTQICAGDQGKKEKVKDRRRRKVASMNVGPTISTVSTCSLMLVKILLFLSQPKHLCVLFFYCICQASLTFNRYFSIIMPTLLCTLEACSK